MITLFHLVPLLFQFITYSHGSATTESCSTECRCLDHGSIMDCQRSAIRRIPRILPSSIILDLDHNRISELSNYSFKTVLGDRGFDAASSSGKKCILEILSMQDNGLTHITAGAFSPLTELRVLRLGANLIHSLDRAVFNHNRRLQVLDLHDNLLKALPGESMYHLHNLESFNISYNRLVAPLVFGSGFKYTTQLSNIDLSGNPIQRLEATSLEVMRNWDTTIERHLNLSHCSLHTLHPRALISIPHLTTLVLSDNPDLANSDLHQALRDLAMNQWSPRVVHFSLMNISNITELLRRFKPSSLEELDLSRNRIQRIPRQSFLFMSNLRMLDLSGNEIEEFENSAGLTRLEDLNLSGNRLRELDERMFEGLHAIKSLDLSHNTLERLTDKSLLNLFNLRHLDVSCNRLQSLTITGMGLESLRTLRVAANRLNGLEFVQRLRRLEVLDISLNMLSELPMDAFRPGLTILSANFSLNGISSINSKAFSSVYLHSVDLSRNRLSRLDYAGWRDLKRLIVSDNRINNISREFLASCGGLEELYLQRNQLHELSDKFFSSLRNLTVLDLSFNHIGESLINQRFTTRTPTQISRLETLILRETGIRILSKEFLEGFESLRNLDLSRNNLKYLDAEMFSHQSNIIRLNLAYNRLQQINTDLLLDRLRSVDLSGNPFKCTCDLYSLCNRIKANDGDRFVGLSDHESINSDVFKYYEPGGEGAHHSNGFQYYGSSVTPIRSDFHISGITHRSSKQTYYCETPLDKNGLPLMEYCLAAHRLCTRFNADIIAVGIAVTVATVAIVLLAGVCVLVALQKRKSRFGVGRRKRRQRGGVSAHGDVRYEQCADETSLTSNTNSMTSPVDAYVTSQEALLTSSDIAYRNWSDSLSW